MSRKNPKGYSMNSPIWKKFWAEATDTDPYRIDFSRDSNGYIITAKNGLEEWWFQAKVITVDYGL